MREKISFLFIMIMVCAIFSSCASKSTYQTGIWNNNTYSSSWSGIKYKIPKGCAQTNDEVFPGIWLELGAFYDDADEKSVNDLEEVVTIEMAVYDSFESNSSLDESSYNINNQIWVVTEEMPKGATVDQFITEYVELLNNYQPMNECTLLDDNAGTKKIGDLEFQIAKLSYDYSIGDDICIDLYVAQKEDRIVYILHRYVKNDAGDGAIMMQGFDAL